MPAVKKLSSRRKLARRPTSKVYSRRMVSSQNSQTSSGYTIFNTSRALSLRGGLIGSTLLPDRYTTWLENSIHFYITAGQLSALAGNYMDVIVNSIYQPFNTTYNATSAINTWDMRGTLVQGSSNTEQPIGYSTLATLYEKYKVKKFKITVTTQPANASDPVQMVLFPLGNDQIPSASAGNINVALFEGQPNAKSKLVVTGSPTDQNTLSLSMKVSDSLGKRDSQWEALDGTNLTGFPGTDMQSFVGLYLQPANGSINSSPVSVIIRLYQQVEFTDLASQIN